MQVEFELNWMTHCLPREHTLQGKCSSTLNPGLVERTWASLHYSFQVGCLYRYSHSHLWLCPYTAAWLLTLSSGTSIYMLLLTLIVLSSSLPQLLFASATMQVSMEITWADRVRSIQGYNHKWEHQHKAADSNRGWADLLLFSSQTLDSVCVFQCAFFGDELG